MHLRPNILIHRIEGERVRVFTGLAMRAYLTPILDLEDPPSLDEEFLKK